VGTAVAVEELRKTYGPVRAVDGVSFSVDRGEVFALLGPNGAGKTTTIEILEGFRERDGGTVRVLGVDPSNRRTQRWLRTRTGVVLQELAVEPYFTVRQVLTRNAGFYPSPRPVDQVIELVGLEEKADARVKTLSGGQQRRLDVGLGIVGRPEILYLDEPTTGLDPSARRASWDLVRHLAGEGSTVILTSHYMDEVEALADRAAVIAAGRVVASGTPASIGGRDVGAVTIRFRMPEGVTIGDLPVVPDGRRGDEIEIRTEDELAVLHDLTGWAIGRGVPLPGLRMSRVTLEDVYLRLTAAVPGTAPVDAGDGHDPGSPNPQRALR
jgi:ABC-2 type transport system ATP-binding protein